MSKRQIQFIGSLIIIVAVSFLSACDYNFALAPKQGLPLDNTLIGVWQHSDTIQIEVSKKNETEYSIVHFIDGEEEVSYTAYPVKIGKQQFVQAQVKEIGQKQVREDIKPYQVFSFSVKGNELTLKSVKFDAKNQAELKEGIIANKPNIFSSVGTFIKTDTLTSSSFLAKGLNNEKVLTNLYLGDFNAIPFKRDNSGFGILYNAYLNSYAQQCDPYLPSNKVEITTQECATERVTRNGYGVEIGRSCVEWRAVGTGLYADPKMYEAKLILDGFQTVNGLRILVDIFKNPEKALGDTLGMVGNAVDAQSDMNNLVRMNPCWSPGLKRFQENLNSFALDKRPIMLINRPKR